MAFSASQKRDHIRELQWYLYNISEFNKAVPAVIPDGIFGRETEIAIRGFQREYGLPETGSADKETWDTIVYVYSREKILEPQCADIFPSPHHVVSYGDKGTLVYIIQALLEGISQKYDNFPSVPINGNYDEPTIRAVRVFQRISRLDENGNVDSITWNRLIKA